MPKIAFVDAKSHHVKKNIANASKEENLVVVNANVVIVKILLDAVLMKSFDII